MKLRSRVSGIRIMMIVVTVIFAVSCKNPTVPVGDTGLQIDASDPLDVLRALPTELSRPASMVARFAAAPTSDAEVFHSDAEICPPLAKEKVDTASLAISVVQILKKMSDNPFNVNIVVDSGQAVALGSLLMEEEIMLPLNATDLNVNFQGIQIDTIAASDSPNNVSGFAYYLPFTFQHDVEYELYNYFEFFYEDDDNMVLTAVTYVTDDVNYYKYHTTIMTIDDGNQIIERYENAATQPDYLGGDDDYTYEKFSYNPQTDTTQAYIISRGSAEGIFAVTADQYGGMAISTYPNEGTIYGLREAFAEDYNVMARFSDSDMSSNLPPVFSTEFDPDYMQYSYRYLEDKETYTGDLLLAKIIGDGGEPGTVARLYSYDPSVLDEGVEDPGDPFLLGATNTSIIDYVTDKVDSYYLDIYDTLEANMDPADTQDAPGWIRMDTTSLGVADLAAHLALSAVFTAIKNL